jgi:aspartate/methionine/tyrosine aminotransferase
MALSFFWKRLLVRSGLARFHPSADRLSHGGKRFLRYYSDRVLAAPVDELTDPATFPNADGGDVLNLNRSAPPVEAFHGGRPPGYHFGAASTNGDAALRAAIAERCGRAVNPDDEVLVTHGATAGFAAVLDAFVNPGDRVVLFDPCSPLFALGAKSRRAKVRWVPTWTEDGRTRFVVDGLARTLRGAMLLAIADPTNPTGGTLSAEDYEQIAWLARRQDVLVYVDQSFDRYRYTDAPRPALAEVVGTENRLLTAGSVTQGYGVGAARVGWVTGPKPLVNAVSLMANLSAPFVPASCQQIALKALTAAESLFAPTRELFRRKRDYTLERLRGMGLEPTTPTGGYTCWVSVAGLGLTGRAFAEKLLREHRVLVGPGAAYGPSGTDFVRISFAEEDGRLREGLTRVGMFVAGLKGEPVVTADRVAVGAPISDAAPTETTPPEAAPDAPTEERTPAFSRA